MTKRELEKTEWAKIFKRECPIDYQEALKLALLGDKLEVSIRKGVFTEKDKHWEIIIAADWDFTMYITRTKKEAVEFCKKMRWKIVS